MLRIGQKVRFDPFDGIRGEGAKSIRGEIVTGVVVYINEPHNWFMVEYVASEKKVRTSFSFFDIGGAVKICGK